MALQYKRLVLDRSLEPRAVFMMIKDYEATRRRTLGFPKAIGQCFGPNSEF